MIILRTISLIIISIISWYVWEWEVNYHGWAGLKWLQYFHYAVPISIAMVIIWITIVLYRNLFHALALMLTLSIFGYAGMIIFDYSLTIYFSGGALLFINMLNNPYFQYLRYLIIPVMILIPIVFNGILYMFTKRLNVKLLIISTFLFCVSPFIGLLYNIYYTNYPDLIHVVKIGSAIPFLIISLCLPLIFKSAQQGDAPEPASPAR